MARDTNNKIAVSAPVAEKPRREVGKPAVPTQEAKDLKALISTLGSKNAPTDSKEITIYAKQTMKMVSQAQKGESASFKRESTKALIGFRSFVEKTEKLTELRRTKILSDIDSMTLDAKNATMMLLTVAKGQVADMKSSAKREIHEEKSRMKALNEEQIEKIKATKSERDDRHKMLVESHKARMLADNESIKKNRLELKDKSAGNKQELAERKIKLNQEHQERKLALSVSNDVRHENLKRVKAENTAKAAKQKDDIIKMRGDTAVQIKNMKGDLRDHHKTRMAKGNSDIINTKANNMVINKKRIARIRDIQAASKAKIKAIEIDAKGNAVIKKAEIKSKIDEINHKEDKRTQKASQRADALKGKIGSGLRESNPVTAAIFDIGKGIHGMLTKGSGDKRKRAAYAKLNANGDVGDSGGPIEAKKPNMLQRYVAKKKASKAQKLAAKGGTSAPAAAPAAAIGSGGGMASAAAGAAKEAEVVGGVLEGIMGILPEILAVVGTVVGVVTSVISFFDGFNKASELFGEKVGDDEYLKRTYSGFVNVVSSILGIFDTVAGWLGFDTNLQDGFKKGAVKLFDAILNTFKSLAGGLADILSYIPGMGGVSKSLKDFSATTSNSPGPAAAIAAKQDKVNDLQDQIDSDKNKASAVQVNADNSVRSNNTTIVQSKMSTRNDDIVVAKYGYGGNR
jgi:hypothetical protein